MSIRKGNDIIASTPAVDTVPQQGSANVITSGGVYTALQDYVTLSTPQTITANKAFNGAKISTNSDIEFTSAVAGLVSNRNGTIRNLITRTSFNEVNVGNPYDPTIILGSGVRPRYNTIEYLALYSDIPGDFTGASSVDSGTNGLVPAPAAGDQGKFLQGDGTWATPTTATAWGNITGTLSSQTDLQDALDSKANTDLSNLTSTGANIGNWSHNVSNCITEIPQDIKLELNNGTLTLKAGSKVYVPNGFEADGVTPKYDTITIASDTVLTSTWSTAEKVVIFVNKSDNSLYMLGLVRLSSGASAPTETNARMWYDTTNNLVKRYAGGADTGDRCSFPITICTKTSANEDAILNTIDQVFNGFGYIGSTVFMLLGVKGLIPNGKNADGSLKNTEVAVEKVRTMNMASYMAGRKDAVLCLFPNASIGGMDILNTVWGSVTCLKDIPRVAYSCWYCEEDNLVHSFDANVEESISQRAFVGSFDVDSNNKISSLDIKQPFHAVDYNDSEFIAHQAMPNYRKAYNIATVASGAAITADCDGYLYIVIDVSVNGYLSVANNYWQSGASGGWIGGLCAIKKGQTAYVYYANLSSWVQSQFIPCVGAK